MTHKQRWTPWSPYDSLAPKANEPAPGGIGYPAFNEWSAAPLPNPSVPVYDPPGGDYYTKPSQPKYSTVERAGRPGRSYDYVQLTEPSDEHPNSVAHRAWTNHWYKHNAELGFFWLGRDADR